MEEMIHILMRHESVSYAGYNKNYIRCMQIRYIVHKLHICEYGTHPATTGYLVTPSLLSRPLASCGHGSYTFHLTQELSQAPSPIV